LESIAFYLQMTVGGGGSDVSAQVERLQQMVDNANWVLSDVLHTLPLSMLRERGLACVAQRTPRLGWCAGT
jgi:hypothetical protein